MNCIHLHRFYGVSIEIILHFSKLTLCFRPIVLILFFFHFIQTTDFPLSEIVSNTYEFKIIMYSKQFMFLKHRWSDSSAFYYESWDAAQGYPDTSNLGWYCGYQRTKDNNGITLFTILTYNKSYNGTYFLHKYSVF